MIVTMLLEILAAVLLVLNGSTFLLFAADKRKAVQNAWRIPEETLFCCAVIGPFGAYAAMKLLRHKTRKWKFFLVPVFLVIQTVALIWFASAAL